MDREQGRRRILAGQLYCLVLAALPAVGVRAEQPTPEDVRADALVIRPFRGPDVCREMDSLSAEDVIHLLDQQRQLNGALAKFFEEHPEGIRMVKAKRRDCIDPPRVVAVIGPAELHHARFACTVNISPTAGLTLGEGPRSKTTTIEIEVRHLHLVSGERAERIMYGRKDGMRADQVGRAPMLPADRYFESEVQYVWLDGGSKDAATQPKNGVKK